ncbi:MAG: 50S ribosomal protein L5 [Patescibacteria group bacterium]|nr:50S ribosomal protein L5 [Patescibacteria group bacterium]
MNLEERFEKEIVPELQENLDISNILAVPRPKKVVVNMGIGEAKDDKDLLEEARRELAQITGQVPNVRRAKHSEAGWGITKGDPIGLAVTLRGTRMWSFLDKIVKAALPRVRDFQGVKKTAFDGHGNYSLGFKDHTIFPEMDADEVDRSKGLQVTIVTSTESDQEGYALLSALGFPFIEEES